MQDALPMIFSSVGAVGVMLFFLLMVVLFVLWICMPFPISGTNPLLRALIAEHKKTNHLLAAAAARSASPTEVVLVSTRKVDA